MDENIIRGILDGISVGSISEDEKIEFKASFDMDESMKAIAAFANRGGGLIFLGVEDGGNIKGLKDERYKFFLNQDNGFAFRIRDFFSPEPEWTPHGIIYNGKNIGVIEVKESKAKPIISKKSANKVIADCTIYYRNKGQSKPIEYAQLVSMLDEIRIQERVAVEKNYNDIFKQIALYGIAGAKVVDPATMTMHGTTGSFTIDERLFEKLKNEFNFIKEGEFDEVIGAETLSVVGDIAIQGSGDMATSVRIEAGSAIVHSVTNDEFDKIWPYLHNRLLAELVTGKKSGSGKIFAEFRQKYQAQYKRGIFTFCNKKSKNPDYKAEPPYQYSQLAYDEIKKAIDEFNDKGEENEVKHHE